MSEVGAADRSRLLRSKRAELSGIVKSRKRKLREFFAVCDNDSPIPQLDIYNPDTPPINPAEAHFLDVTDILQDRLFDECYLPARRQIRPDSLKQRIPIYRNESTDLPRTDSPYEVSKSLRDDTKLGEDRATISQIGDRVDISNSITQDQLGRNLNQESLMNRSSPKSNGEHTTSSSKSTEYILNFKKNNSNLEILSDNGTGIPDTGQKVATAVAIPDDANQLSRNQSLQAPCAKILLCKNKSTSLLSITPKKYQFRAIDSETSHAEETVEHQSIGISCLHRCTETLSSPSSTVDTISAATSAIHDVSTDTSADYEGHYDAEKISSINGIHLTLSKPSKSQESKVLNVRVNKPCDQALQRKASVTHDKSVKFQENNSSKDERDAPSSDLQIEEINDEVLNSLDSSENLAGDVTNKDSKTSSSILQNISLDLKDGSKQDTMESQIEKKISCEINAEVDDVIISNSSKGNISSEDPLFSSFIQSEKSEPIDDNLESPLGSKTLSLTPTIQTKSTAAVFPVSERRNTRIGSGALERRTVSEIIGDSQLTSGSNSKSLTKPDLDSSRASNYGSRGTNSQSSSTRVRVISQKQKGKGRSKLSNVIFANKPLKLTSDTNSFNGTASQTESPREDYFTPLFLATASAGKGSIPALDTLLATAHKTITTSNAYVPIHDNQTSKILKRIYHLQSSHKWSLRQPKRSIEPIRPKTHWDILLQEASWMRTDFKEERKWKKTIARNIAFACAEWVSSSQTDRKALQVKVSSPQTALIKDKNQICVSKSSYSTTPEEMNQSILDLEDEPRPDPLEIPPPTDIFGLQNDDVVFSLQKSPTADKLLSELPLYGSPLQIPNNDLQSDLDPDRFWKRPALPLSKYVEGKIRLNLDPPPRKKSRFEYEEEEEEEEDTQAEFGEERIKQPPLPPECTDVALFDPKYRHILERIRNVNCFRPPSEFQMPLQTFFECRTASQWTWEEDKELKVLVRDYTYNWSLISNILSTKSKSNLTTGAERRTPWECFERWIELEGLPGDMQKTYYFRLYTSRIENANRNIMATQPTQNAQGQIQQARKRSTSSIRVERRRNQKHLVLIDTMRKLAKKRETTIQKQQHAAGIAAMRKAQETPHLVNRNLSATTPQDFSRLKHEREEVMKERFLQIQQRQEAAMAHRNSGANLHQTGLQNILRPPTSASPVSNGSNPGNQARPHQAPSQMPNNHPLSTGVRSASMTINSMPQAPMQGQMSTSNPPLDAGLVSRAHAISQHQQAILRQQKQQQSQVNSQPPQTARINGVSTPGLLIQGNLIPPFSSNTNGVPTSTSVATPISSPGSTDSRRVAQIPQSLSHVQHMEIQYKAKYPSATPDQITSMISQALSQTLQQQQRQNISQSSVNTVAGGQVATTNNLSGSQSTPQMYAQMLRHQQDNLHKQHAGTGGGNFQSNLPGSSVNGNNGLGHAHRASTGSLPSSN